MISAQHMAITPAPDEGVYELTDLSSTNGTIVDGEPVETTVRLRDGSIIFVGSHVLVFRVTTVAQRTAIEAELSNPLGPVATANPAFAMVCQKLRKLAAAGEELLLTGETGVGKEVYAEAVHRASGRTGRFVAINCAAIPRELVETELFGYARGAHSQAAMAKGGIIEEAENGTLFLDEIGEMAPELQTKLLRFTQDRMLSPVGGLRARRIETRIVAATSRTAAPSQSGSLGLRVDLAARLGAEPIRIPPLRERVEDLGALASHLLGVAEEADRADRVPGALSLPLARQRPRARQGHDLGRGAGARFRSDRDRAPAGDDLVGAAGQGFGGRPTEIASTARCRRAGGVDSPISGQHDARLPRARPEAGAGLPLGKTVRPESRRLSG